MAAHGKVRGLDGESGDRDRSPAGNQQGKMGTTGHTRCLPPSVVRHPEARLDEVESEIDPIAAVVWRGLEVDHGGNRPGDNAAPVEVEGLPRSVVQLAFEMEAPLRRLAEALIPGEQ